jgi:hypothetical protein
MTMLVLSSLLLLGPLQGAQGETQTTLPTQRSLPVYNISLLMIGRSVEDAEPADEQLGWGVEFDAYNPRSAFGWEIGLSRTSDDETEAGVDFDAKLIEVYTGGRKTWGASSDFHPYVGLGVSWIDAEVDVPGLGSEEDESFGFYGHGGAYWTLGEHFNVGADLRALVGTDLDFGDANYLQAALVLGYSI